MATTTVVNIDQIHAGLIKFIDTEIAPKATGFTKFMVYFFVPSLSKFLVPRYEAMRASGMFSELFTEEGNLKLEDAFARVRTAMEKTGKLMIPQINYFVDSTDVEKLYHLIKSA